jgi:GntR family transcriptional repressor for pyruvate dehydrogenase complex
LTLTGRGGRTSHVVEQLRELIVCGNVTDGQFLGTEGELVSRFGISRPSLREALRRLEGEGLIEVAVGVGGGVTAHRPDERMTARAVTDVLRSRDVATTDLLETYSCVAAIIARRIAGGRRHRIVASELRSLIPPAADTLDPWDYDVALYSFQRRVIHGGPSPTMNVLAATLHEVIDSRITSVGVDTAFGTLVARRRHARSQRQLTELIASGSEAETAVFWRRYLFGLNRTLTSAAGVLIDRS